MLQTSQPRKTQWTQSEILVWFRSIPTMFEVTKLKENRTRMDTTIHLLDSDDKKKKK